MPSIDDLAERLASYLEPDQIDQVRRAYSFAAEAHEGQYRKSGEPYSSHPLAVAFILADMHMDHYCFCLLYTSPSPRDKRQSRMPSSA